MKELIPIKKDIIFKTKIGEITNIDLEHDYNIKDNLIEGNINLSGSYKMTEASVLEDEFNYKIPFKVSISKEVNKDTIKIDIDDFKYEINKDVLNVEVLLLFTCEEIIKEDYKLENPIKEEHNEVEKNEVIEEDNNTIIEPIKEEVDIDENINNITNIINNNNQYYTYKVYIVKENDSIDSICLKYNVSLDILKEYNNINEIHEGDKIIIPFNND